MRRHAWYTPTGVAARVLYEVALHMPNDLDMLVAAAYGIVEVCGLRRACKPLFRALINSLKRRQNA